MIRNKILVLLVACLGMTGCSVKFAYNNVDRLVRWQISDYLDLDAQQKQLVRAEIASMMAWHRQAHLPLYAEYIRQLTPQLREGVSEAQLAGLFEQLFVWGDEISAQGMPGVIQLMASLSDKQVARLPEKLAEDNAEFIEDEFEVPLAEIQADWASQFEDALERFTGRLDSSQRDYLARRAEFYQPERELWVAYRQRWQADLLSLLRDKRKTAEFGEAFRALVAARPEYYSEQFKTVSEENILLSREAAAYILSNLTEKQSNRFADALLELAEDFEELAAAGKTAKS